MAFGFTCHIVSAIMTMTANGYAALYWGTFIFALAGGVVEGRLSNATRYYDPRAQ